MSKVALGSLVFLVACGSTAHRAQTAATTVPEAPTEEEGAKEAPQPPPDVEASALPYSILSARGGSEIATEDFYKTLLASRAVCVGESHTDAHHHWAQLEVIDQLTKDGRGASYGTGMEMFQRPVQGVLNDFSAGKISEEDMLSRADWKRRWSYDWNFYAPQVRMIVARGGQVLALNISKELKDKWKKHGVEGMTPEDAAKIPELNLKDQEHYDWFRSLMESFETEGEGHGTAAKEDSAHALFAASLALLGDQDLPPGHPTLPPGHPTPKGKKAPKGHGKGHKMPKGHGKGHKMPKGHGKGHKMPKGHGKGKAVPNDAVHNPAHPDNTAHDASAHGHGAAPEQPKSMIDSIYPVQVLWDETMADTAAKWLQEDANRRIIILAGNGHCHDSAIVRRMKRRGIDSVVSVRPVIDSGSGEVADVLASPRNDYLFVMKKAAEADAEAPSSAAAQ